MPREQLKPIHSLFDVVPVFNEELLQLGKWLTETTLCFMVSAFQAMLPAAMKAKYEKDIRLIEQHMPFIHEKVRALFRDRLVIPWSEVAQTPYVPLLQKEIANGHIEVVYRVERKRKNKNRKVGRTARKRR
ncbi:primosome assembly protein PriA [Anoxybacillus sp. BCO1]|nr:primosome assembly protein PriA [Anoxybacillus sp. BCO1]